ncbi:MAG: tellurite resistance/C4-dicarboxylate transporter family protein [Alphaproteobacteria bacterium]
MRRLFDEGFPYGYFACVMATGIVSIAARLEGLAWLSNGLFGLNLAQFSFWGAALVVWFCMAPATAGAELLGSRGPGSLTLVAALCVLGDEMALATAYQTVVDIFCVAAGLLWVVAIYAILARATIRLRKPDGAAAIDGSWLLIVVATQGVAILSTHTSRALELPDTALFVALCLFLLGSAFYAVLITLIVARWMFLPLRPEQFTAPYWINMGAAAITTLAGTRLLAASDQTPAMLPFREAALAATVLFWTIASWWIPLLAMLTLWRYCRGVRPVYRIDNWAMVFPIGMYTAASWHVARDAGLPFLAPVSDVFIWLALAAWALTFAGMIRSWAAAASV